MEEKLQIPDLTTVAVKIAREYMQDLREQRIMLAKRLMNLPEEVLAEIHLREWYHNYWYLADKFRRGRLPEEERELCKKIIAEAPSLDTVHKQYAALALILFEKETEAWALADKNLWPKKLREDMETFMRWNKLGNFDLELKVSAAIVRNRQINFFSYRAGFSLSHFAERQDNPAELFRRQIVKHVALVFFNVRRLFQPVTPVFKDNPRIMSGCQIIRADVIRELEKFPELNFFVTANAGIWRPPAQVFRHEIIFNLRAKFPAKIRHVMLNPQLRRDPLRVLNLRRTATTALAKFLRLKPHRHADDFKAAIN